MAKLGYRAVAVVGHRLDQDRNAADAIALVGDLVVIYALGVAAAAFDGAVDSVVRHVGRLCVQNAFAQTRVCVRITAARAGSDRYLFDKLCKDLAALRIRRAFLMLYCVPL